MPGLYHAISESSLLAAWQEVQANDLEDGKVSDQVVEHAHGVLARMTDLGGGSCISEQGPPEGHRNGLRSFLPSRWAVQALARLHPQLNEAKSRVESFDEGVDFFGTTVTARSGIRAEERPSPLESTLYITEPGAGLRTTDPKQGGRACQAHPLTST
jgi:hypothetical protein